MKADCDHVYPTEWHRSAKSSAIQTLDHLNSPRFSMDEEQEASSRGPYLRTMFGFTIGKDWDGIAVPCRLRHHAPVSLGVT